MSAKIWYDEPAEIECHFKNFYTIENFSFEIFKIELFKSAAVHFSFGSD